MVVPKIIALPVSPGGYLGFQWILEIHFHMEQVGGTTEHGDI